MEKQSKNNTGVTRYTLPEPDHMHGEGQHIPLVKGITTEIFIPATPIDPDAFSTFVEQHACVLSMGGSPEHLSRPYIIIGESLQAMLYIRFPEEYSLEPSLMNITARFTIKSALLSVGRTLSSAPVTGVDVSRNEDPGTTAPPTVPKAIHKDGCCLFCLFDIITPSMLTPCALGRVGVELSVVSTRPRGTDATHKVDPIPSVDMEILPVELQGHTRTQPMYSQSAFNEYESFSENLDSFSVTCKGERPVELAAPIAFEQVSVDPVVIVLINNLPVVPNFMGTVEITDVSVVFADGATALGPETPCRQALLPSESIALQFTKDASPQPQQSPPSTIVNMTSVMLRPTHFTPAESPQSSPDGTLSPSPGCQLNVQFRVALPHGPGPTACGHFVASGPVVFVESTQQSKQAVQVDLARSTGELSTITVTLTNTDIMSHHVRVELLPGMSCIADTRPVAARADAIAVPTMDFSALGSEGSSRAASPLPFEVDRPPPISIECSECVELVCVPIGRASGRTTLNGFGSEEFRFQCVALDGAVALVKVVVDGGKPLVYRG